MNTTDVKAALTTLLVEDEPDAAEEIRDSLEDIPLEFMVAHDGTEALALARSGAFPDLIISDVYMPALGGIDMVAQLLTEVPAGHQCAVIFVSGRPDVEAVTRALQLEAVDFLRKPLDRTRLRDAVERAREKISQRRAAATRQFEVLSDLREFRAEAERLGAALRALPAPSEPVPKGMSADAFLASGDGARASCLALVRKLQRLRCVRTKVYEGDLDEDASLDMLLDLQSALLQGALSSVTSLCAAAGVPQTTALRRIETLEKRGFLLRSPDPKDRRRHNVTLTEAGREKVLAYLSAVSDVLA